MDQTDHNPVIIIGGITGGIGSQLAQILTEKGATVAGYARRPERASDLGPSLDGLTVRGCDATKAEEVEQTIDALATEFGRIDGYVHAIGSIFLKPAHLTSPDDFLSTIELNLTSAFNGLRAVTKRMTKQGSGACVFFSTAAAQTGIANHEAIAAAKGGIEAMVRSAAASYAARGLRFNAIAPSLTETPLSQPIVGDERALEVSKRMHPLGRIANAREVAQVAAWLLSEDGNFVTGQTVVVDGGLSTIVPKPRA